MLEPVATAPTVDPETGNVYVATTYGIFACFDRDGTKQFEISMQERFGRLTFPNGRAGAPVIDGDKVIIHAVTSYWGAEGPARDRIVDYVTAHQPAILLMGAGARARWSLPPGGAATTVFEQTVCDLLVCKPPGFLSPLLVTQ